MVGVTGAAGEQPLPAGEAPRKRSRWGEKDKPADGDAEPADDGGDAKRQRKSKVYARVRRTRWCRERLCACRCILASLRDWRPHAMLTLALSPPSPVGCHGAGAAGGGGSEHK